MDKKVLIAGGVVAVGCGAIAFLVWRHFHKKKDKPEEVLDEGEIRQQAVEKIRQYEESVKEPEEEAVEEPEDEGLDHAYMVEETKQYKIFPEQEKPPLEDMLVEEAEEKEEEEMPSTMWGTAAVEFSNDGTPLFPESAFLGEEGRIDVIMYEDYNDLNDYVEYTRDAAVWFPSAGVMVNVDLEPIEVIDSVGPTTFTQLVKNPDRVLYVANHELKRLYEVSVNDTELEEVMEEVYPTYATSSDM